MKSETSIEQSVRLVFGVTYIVSFLALCSAIDNSFFFDTHIIEPDLKYLYSNKMYCKNPFIDYTARETAVSSVSVDKKNPPNNRFYFLAFLSWLSSLTNDTDVGLTMGQQDQLLFTSPNKNNCKKEGYKCCIYLRRIQNLIEYHIVGKTMRLSLQHDLEYNARKLPQNIYIM